MICLLWRVSKMENKSIMSMDIYELRLEVATLRERCEQLQLRLDKANQYPVQPIWNAPAPPWNGNYSKCSKCGVDLSGSGYRACLNRDCPTSTKVTC
jgi:hypothetical protein